MYQDIDDKDQICYHLCGWEEDNLVAYARLLPQGVKYAEASIGRVCTKATHRKGGHGKTLMLKSIEESGKIFGVQNLKIEAQAYLLGFYNSVGFIQVSEIYDDHDVPHMDMLYTAPVVNGSGLSSD